MSTFSKLSYETMNHSRLLFVREDGEYRLALPSEVLATARTMIDQLVQEGEYFGNPELAKRFFCAKLGGLAHEVFGVAFLSAQLELVAYREMFSGTNNQAAVFPREIVRSALELQVSRLMIVHNHPSGVTEPSPADKQLTYTLVKALELFSIELVDHFIVGGNKALSFRDSGLM